MSRLSREKKREQKQAAHAASPAAPIDVHVPGPGTDTGTGGTPEGASVGGVRVFAAPGEEIQQAVLGRLHHIALATGHPVLATVHDERIGYVVPLRVDVDGSSHFTSEPLRTPPAGPVHTPPAGSPQVPPAGDAQVPSAGPAQVPSAGPVATPPAGPVPMPPAGPVPMPPAGPVHAGATAESSRPAFDEPSRQERAETAPPVPAGPERPEGDRATHVLRPVPEPARGTTPTFPLRAVPEPQPADEPVPTFELRAVQEPTPQDAPPATPHNAPTPPGTVAPPTGAFGPPPPMDARPLPGPEAGHPPVDARPLPGPEAGHPPVDARPLPGSEAGHPPVDARPLPVPGSGAGVRSEPVPDAALLAADPDPKPTPARGFDAVAEAVLGDEPLGAPGDSAAPALLAEPVARINEAVKEGRIDAAAELADQTVAHASATLGPEHPEVLRLRELTAYIAYLAGDPLRAFHLSLDLAGARRRAGDAEGAYGNVRSAATAWRAVRDPALGLELGRGLVGLWTELASEGGPAAEEIEELESARARMGRLTARAGRQ